MYSKKSDGKDDRGDKLRSLSGEGIVMEEKKTSDLNVMTEEQKKNMPDLMKRVEKYGFAQPLDARMFLPDYMLYQALKIRRRMDKEGGRHSL